MTSVEYWNEHKESVMSLLRNGACIATFTKVDGSLREMNCTTSADLIPEAPENDKPKREKKHNPDVMAVFDLDKQEWRSFRWENLKTIYTKSVLEA
jgi:hypothetical protein